MFIAPLNFGVDSIVHKTNTETKVEKKELFLKVLTGFFEVTAGNLFNSCRLRAGDRSGSQEELI